MRSPKRNKPISYSTPINTTPSMELDCANDACQSLLNEFRSQTAHLEQLKIENEVLKISLRDNADLSETAIRELRRLLDKETSQVSILNAEHTPDPSGLFPTCSGCVHFRQQAKAVREANAQEYKWVVHFAKKSQHLRLELEEAMFTEKTKYAQLNLAYDELFIKKTDPFCRDAEIVRICEELAEAKVNQSNANRTALMANRVADTVQKELLMLQQTAGELETERNNLKIKVRALEEIVDACRKSEELRDCKVGECQDYVCRSRVMGMYTKEKELRVQIEILQREKINHVSTIAQMQHDTEQWKSVMGESGDVVVKEEPKEIVPMVIKAKAKDPVVCTYMDDELIMNLSNVFSNFPGWNEEELASSSAFPSPPLPPNPHFTHTD